MKDMWHSLPLVRMEGHLSLLCVLVLFLLFFHSFHDFLATEWLYWLKEDNIIFGWMNSNKHEYTTSCLINAFDVTISYLIFFRCPTSRFCAGVPCTNEYGELASWLGSKKASFLQVSFLSGQVDQLGNWRHGPNTNGKGTTARVLKLYLLLDLGAVNNNGLPLAIQSKLPSQGCLFILLDKKGDLKNTTPWQDTETTDAI